MSKCQPHPSSPLSPAAAAADQHRLNTEQLQHACADVPEETSDERRRRLARERLQRHRRNLTEERHAELRRQHTEQQQRRRQSLTDEMRAEERRLHAEQEQRRRQSLTDETRADACPN